MAGNGSKGNVDTEAIENMMSGLTVFSNNVEEEIKKMETALKDCRDNMGDDTYGKEAAEEFEIVVGKLRKTVDEASTLKRRMEKLLASFEE